MSVNVITKEAFGKTSPTNREGLTLRQAGLVVAFSMLIMTGVTPSAEFGVFHKLINPGNIGQTVQNILGHKGLFLTGIFLFLLNYILDVIIAWGLYFCSLAQTALYRYWPHGSGWYTQLSVCSACCIL